MEKITADRWPARQKVAHPYSSPAKTPTQWAMKGIGPPYAKFGRHATLPLERRNRLGKNEVRHAKTRLGMIAALRTSSQVVAECPND
jgi:hypothetical protein